MPQQESRCTCTCHDISRPEKEAVNNYTLRCAGTQAILDDRIASLEADLLTLKTMRNRYSPISWLPTEALTEILLKLVQPVGRYKPQSWKTHVELTRVCTHWRSIAMQCPQFWSCAPFMSWKGTAKHIEMMLARSMDYPFSIRKGTEEDEEEDIDSDDASESSIDDSQSDGDVDGTSNTLQRTLYLQAQTHRLRQLYLKVDTDKEQLQQYEYLIAQDLPSLETLDVDLVGINTYTLLLDFAPSPFSPEFVLSSHRMLSLRSLRLSGFAEYLEDWEILSRSTFNTQNLTDLKLSVDCRPPPYDLLLEVLRASPLLRTLKLFNCLEESISDVFESSNHSTADKVYLPGLASLSLESMPSLAALVHFLSDLVFPSDSKIKFRDLHMDRPVGGHPSPQTQSELIRRLFLYCGLGGPEYSARAGLRRYQMMRLRIGNSDHRFTELYLSNPCLCPSDGRSVRASGKHSCPGNGPTSMILAGEKLPELILKHLPQGILVLDVVHYSFGLVSRPVSQRRSSHGVDLPTTEDWRNFFTDQSSIQELRLDGEDMRKVLYALGPRPLLSMPSDSDIGQDADVRFSTDVDRVHPAYETLLPRLRSLSFAEDVLVDRGNGPPPTLVSGSSNYDSLKTMLIMRRKHGLPISSIGLTPSSELTPAQHEMKEEICAINGQGTVVWGS